MKLEEGKFYDRGYGGIFGIISILIALIGMLISYSAYPGYIIGDHTISMLGVGRLGISFNIGSIVSGLLAIPYYLNLSYHFQAEDIDEWFIDASLISSMGSCIGYIFVGVFPVYGNNFFFYAAHMVFALTTFLSGAVYLIIYAYMMYHSESFTKLQAIHSLLVCIFYLSFVFTQIPLLEWIALFGLISWISGNSIYLLIIND
jgi:hypothetical membrane protein